MKIRLALVTVLSCGWLLQACDNNSSNASPVVPQLADQLMAGAASRSMLPTVNGGRDYLAPIVYGGERKLKAFEKSLARTGLLPPGYSALPGKGAACWA